MSCDAICCSPDAVSCECWRALKHLAREMPGLPALPAGLVKLVCRRIPDDLSTT